MTQKCANLYCLFTFRTLLLSLLFYEKKAVWSCCRHLKLRIGDSEHVWWVSVAFGCGKRAER